LIDRLKEQNINIPIKHIIVISRNQSKVQEFADCLDKLLDVQELKDVFNPDALNTEDSE